MGLFDKSEKASTTVEYSYVDLSFEKTQAHAKARGQVIRLPEKNELFVDIDTKEQLQHFHRMLPRLAKHEDRLWLDFVCTPSRSGGDRLHVVVKLPRDVMSDLERIALQAILGSDPVRELISIARVKFENPHPSVFFENP